MTTGATLAECASVLKRAGVPRVDVWALARAPSRQG
jgi:predicted amidophosphoribosyltransferase